MPFQRIFIAGSGRQSVAAGYDLLRFIPDLSLTLSDTSPAQVERSAARIQELLPDAQIDKHVGDVDNVPAISVAMEGHEVVLAGVPYYLNPKVHAAARRAGLPSVDMGSDLPDLEAELGPRTGDHETVAVFDSGLAPGLGNQLARHLAGENEQTDDVRIYCGGLPLEPRTPLKYRPRFSLAGLVGEYTDPAIALKNGRVTTLESLTELESVQVPELGELEAFVTSGGSSISPLLLESKLDSYAYKTLRFPGHCAAMIAYRELGLWKDDPIDFGAAKVRPFDLFEKLFTHATLAEDSRDQVVLLVEARGPEATRRLFVRHTFDPQTGLSAMEQLTGFCASIVVQRVLEAELKPGLYAAEEVVSGQDMILELARRQITVQEI